jgi:hypothetical protein
MLKMKMSFRHITQTDDAEGLVKVLSLFQCQQSDFFRIDSFKFDQSPRDVIA